MFRGRFGVAVLAVLVVGARPAMAATPALIPAPASVVRSACAGGGLRLDRALRFPPNVDPGGLALVRERWTALAIPIPRRSGTPQVILARSGGVRWGASSAGGIRDERYALVVRPGGVIVRSRGAAGEFDALTTLAQLPVRHGAGWALPCVTIEDRPALAWRIVSDDISRGPFPTPRYVRERIRTLASLKINGWSPYMEHVFKDVRYPYIAFPNALSAAELHDLAQYARRYHVTLVPQQQTFAHMHESLKYEQLAPLAELPHGYLLAASDPGTYAYLDPLLRAEAAAVGPTPFFHIGADEPIDLGRGRTPRTPQVFAGHVNRLAAVVEASGARPVIWDDAIQQDPGILRRIDRRTVIATFHYGAEASFAKYIATVAQAGFDQFVSPGANDWNEIYADLDTAYANESQFVADGKAAHVLGMFATVWHDDGESLYEATWSPIAFAAASAWQTRPVDRVTWHRQFARAFFGTDDAGFARDLDALAAMRSGLRTPPTSDPPNYLFWADPFDARIAARVATRDIPELRRRAEAILTHLDAARPPLHAEAAAVMRLAALRYDVLGRRFEIGAEVRAAYDDARAHVTTHDDAIVYRDLNVAKYFCWELRDELTALEPLYARAWRYESTPPGLANVLTRYHLGAQQALDTADRLNAAAREDYLRARTLPPFEQLLDDRR